MIKKIALSLVCVASLIAASAQATTGVFGGYIVFEIDGPGEQFFKLENPDDNLNPPFNGEDLGTFDPATGSLILSGGEGNTFKNSGGDVTAVFLNYRVFESGNPNGSFITINLPFDSEFGGNPSFGNNPGDQKWQSLAPNDNLLFGRAPGSYTIQAYISAQTNEGERFLNNGGANYAASFTVVPEPSSLTLLAGPAILGAWFFVRRRRA